MREKEYTCAIAPYEEGLLLSTLNYCMSLGALKGWRTSRTKW